MESVLNRHRQPQFSIARLPGLLTALGLWLPVVKWIGGIWVLQVTLGDHVLLVLAWMTLRGPDLVRELWRIRRMR
jgi:hypothetical protein